MSHSINVVIIILEGDERMSKREEESKGEYYSNCLIEAIKAKIKWGQAGTNYLYSVLEE